MTPPHDDNAETCPNCGHPWRTHGCNTIVKGVRCNCQQPATANPPQVIEKLQPRGSFRGHTHVSGRLIPSQALVEEAVRVLLLHVGEDPTRDGLLETPARVAKAFREMTVGYSEDPAQILSKTFLEPYDEMIVVKDIPFTSLCEHHLLVFMGTVDIGYIPGKVVGLSKLARLVDCFSRRLQIQERLTREIADSIAKHLEALGVAVVVRASHECMSCRGVRKSGVMMITSVMLGALREKSEARAEFLALCR